MNADRTMFTLLGGWVVFMVAVIAIVFIFALEQDPPPTPYVRPTPLPIEPTPTPEPRPGPTAAQLRSHGLGVLPPVTMPDDNPLTTEKAELGKILFFDRRMSGNGIHLGSAGGLDHRK